MIKHIFLYISATVALYASVSGLIALLFQVINNTYPDQALYYINPYNDAVRFALATLIITFPLYVLFMWLVRKTEEAESDLRKSSFRKWVIYITLFIAGGILAGDAIAVLNEFLSGELVVRFGLKALALAVIIALVFIYYIYDLRKDNPKKTKIIWIFEGIATILVIGSVVCGFLVLGSPVTQRELRLDAERVQDLQEIQWNIVDYWQRKQVLPNSLDDLEKSMLSYTVPIDPETGEVYGYQVIGVETFELCATFDQESQQRSVLARPKGGLDINWSHGGGRVCFERTIDEDFYKPID